MIITGLLIGSTVGLTIGYLWSCSSYLDGYEAAFNDIKKDMERHGL